jgi:hypothetical protein
MGTHAFFFSTRLLICILTGLAGASESHEWVLELALGVGETVQSARSTAMGQIAFYQTNPKKYSFSIT